MRSKYTPEQDSLAALLWPAQTYDPIAAECSIAPYDSESTAAKSAAPSEHASDVYGSDRCKQQWNNRWKDDCNCQYTSCSPENSANYPYNLFWSKTKRFSGSSKTTWFNNSIGGNTVSSYWS